MEKEMEKQTDSKIRKNKLNLIIVVLMVFISLVVFAVVLKYFLPKPSTETASNENVLQENSAPETNSPIISIHPNEKDEENNIGESIESDTTQENIDYSQSSNNVSSPVVPEDNTNQNASQNITSNNNSNSNNNVNTNNNSNDASSNTGSGNNSDTTNNSSNDNASSIPPSPPAPVVKPYIVKTETSRDLTKTQTKYGVIINTYTTSTYDVYSDGNKVVTYSFDEIEYDKSNYSATTSELLSEARTARSQYSAMISQIIKNTNNYRKEANTNSVDGITNRSSLSINENLCVAACARAIEMAYSSKFSHTRPNGGTFYSILDEMNISYMTAGENIAKGYSNADSVSEGWKNSKGHYENMILSDFSQIGIGVFKLEGTYYWVQIFN